MMIDTSGLSVWPRRLGVLAAGVVLTLAAGQAEAQQGPIKIGVIVPLSGPLTPNGEDAVAGMRMYFDEIGNTVDGRKIELIVEDEQNRPDVALTKARKLIESDHVQMLSGIASSAVALAISEYSRDKKIPLIISADGGANELTIPGPLFNPYLVRATQNGRTPSAAAADFMYKKGWRKVAVVSADYAGGYDTISGFAQAFCKLGGTVTQEQYPPISTSDFGPYITNLDRSADALAFFTPGAGGLRFLPQLAEQGVKMPLMDIFGQTVYEPNLPQEGDAALGVYSTLHYTPMLKTPENEAFVKAFVARTKHLPSDNGPDGWVGAKTIADGAHAVGGKVEDTDKFIAGMKATKFHSPKGDISYDQYGQVIQSMFVRQTQKTGSDYANVVIETYNNVDQFWPTNLADFESYKHRYVDLKGSLTNCAKVLEKK